LSAHDPTKWDWGGQSGLKVGAIQALRGHIGDTYLLPLFKAYNHGVPDPTTYQAGVGTGNNYCYNIVQFVGVRITRVAGRRVFVQPAAVAHPELLFTGIGPATPPATSSSSLTTTFTYPRLSQ
jgi:hypothetical protein